MDSEGEPPRDLYHVHFVSWPDFGGVQDLGLYLRLHDCLDNCMRQQAEAPSPLAGPMVVHCSAGVGRTGTYIAIQMLLTQLKAAVQATAHTVGGVDAERDKMPISIIDVVVSLRAQRPAMVVTSEQYLMIYQVLYFCLFGQALVANATPQPPRNMGHSDNDVYRHELRNT
mmetsp:Transcript_24388/g.68937  ORF Transcript_24388/g.68937 Transcript_24388/m.68937 type:complete len:170 (+) Transcript_24388:56-565(+)